MYWKKVSYTCKECGMVSFNTSCMLSTIFKNTCQRKAIYWKWLLVNHYLFLVHVVFKCTIPETLFLTNMWADIRCYIGVYAKSVYDFVFNKHNPCDFIRTFMLVSLLNVKALIGITFSHLQVWNKERENRTVCS